MSLLTVASLSKLPALSPLQLIHPVTLSTEKLQILSIKRKSARSMTGVQYLCHHREEQRHINFYDTPIESSFLGIYFVKKESIDKINMSSISPCLIITKMLILFNMLLPLKHD